MPSTVVDPHLPDSSSSSLALVQATEAEKLAGWRLNAVAWRGQFDDETYVRREIHLADQALTRNGGITYWILVNTLEPPSSKGARRILASCETLRKRALISRGAGVIEEVLSHGIGSVFSDPALRGRGYASRMLAELGKKLDTWGQKENKSVDFTVLWSDIGKHFYAKLGWKCFHSTHIALQPMDEKSRAQNIPEASLLSSHDLGALCKQDEAMLRSNMARAGEESSDIRVALIPDVETIQWHHAREEFLANELLHISPNIKGALATCKDGSKVWCIWTRTFGQEQNENTLNILRIVIESETLSNPQNINSTIVLNESTQATVLAVASVLQAAQLEAAKWNMAEVHFWNPSPLSLLGAKMINPSASVIDRDKDSITSLRWHGPALQAGEELEWVSNEKYGWC